MQNHSRRPSRTNLTRVGSRTFVDDVPTSTIVSAHTLPPSLPRSASITEREVNSKNERRGKKESSSMNSNRFISIALSRLGGRSRGSSINDSTVRSTQTNSPRSANARLIQFFIILLVCLLIPTVSYIDKRIFGVNGIINRDSFASGSASSLGNKIRYPISFNQDGTGPWVIAVIADLDKDSCRIQKEEGKSIHSAPCRRANAWASYYKRGLLSVEKSIFGSLRRTRSSVQWLDEIEIIGRGHADLQKDNVAKYGGRGMELSELEWFSGHLLTPDDHTGILLEITTPRGRMLKNEKDIIMEGTSGIPPSTLYRAFLADGSGNDKTAHFKSEWMVVKDDNLLIGGHGRPYTAPGDGSKIISTNPTWIKVVDKKFQVSHEDWGSKYEFVARAVDVTFPGYLMHEAVLWSKKMRKWVFLPRRKSGESFDSAQNERQGTNVVIIVDENFTESSAIEIEGLRDSTGLKGFSSAKFVPGKHDQWIAAIRTIEIDNSAPTKSDRRTESYLSVFDLSSGNMILEEERFSEKKFEGLAFL